MAAKGGWQLRGGWGLERNCDREIVRNIKEKMKKKQQQEETEKRLHNSSDKNFLNYGQLHC